VNKSQLVAFVAEQLNTSKAGAARLVDTVLDGVKLGLTADRRVTISGFGTFEVKNRKARTGINPHTKEPIQISAGRRVGFRVGKSLKQVV
jgi:DNA-binding protein HU-beta